MFFTEKQCFCEMVDSVGSHNRLFFSKGLLSVHTFWEIPLPVTHCRKIKTDLNYTQKSKHPTLGTFR